MSVSWLSNKLPPEGHGATGQRKDQGGRQQLRTRQLTREFDFNMVLGN